MAVCMDRIRMEAHISVEIPMTYAGRLDPMAEGLVVFLYGDARFQKDFFLKMNKSYYVEFFLGYETDTFDVLGIAKQAPQLYQQEMTMETVESFQKPGTFTQNFPAYSSRKILGKPLFTYAKNSMDVPVESHDVTLYHYADMSRRFVQASELVNGIIADINNVSGDFRQQESITSWQVLEKSFPGTITVYGISMTVSSGFYVRQWVNDFGKFLSTSAVTFRIVRDTIGIFTMSMLNGESYRVFYEHDPLISNLTK